VEVQVNPKSLLLALFLLTPTALAQDVFDKPDPLDGNMKTGPAVGEKIPPFEAVDQNGRIRDFDSIKGPNGALLLFYRSADW
jgi:hypothetical protein